MSNGGRPSNPNDVQAPRRKGNGDRGYEQFSNQMKGPTDRVVQLSRFFLCASMHSCPSLYGATPRAKKSTPLVLLLSITLKTNSRRSLPNHITFFPWNSARKLQVKKLKRTFGEKTSSQKTPAFAFQPGAVIKTYQVCDTRRSSIRLSLVSIKRMTEERKRVIYVVPPPSSTYSPTGRVAPVGVAVDDVSIDAWHDTRGR